MLAARSRRQNDPATAVAQGTWRTPVDWPVYTLPAICLPLGVRSGLTLSMPHRPVQHCCTTLRRSKRTAPSIRATLATSTGDVIIPAVMHAEPGEVTV